MLRQVKCHEAIRLLCCSLNVFAVFVGQKHPHFARQPLQKVVREEVVVDVWLVLGHDRQQLGGLHDPKRRRVDDLIHLLERRKLMGGHQCAAQGVVRGGGGFSFHNIPDSVRLGLA
jgi:hypothetical protein